MKDGIINGLKDLGTWILNTVRNAINALIKKVNSLLEFSFTINIPDRIPGLPDAFTVNVNPPDIPQLAKGGRALAGVAHLVGEGGPELFVPGRPGSVIPNAALAGGGRGVTVHVHVAGSVIAERDLVSTIRREFVAISRRNGPGSLGFT